MCRRPMESTGGCSAYQLLRCHRPELWAGPAPRSAQSPTQGLCSQMLEVFHGRGSGGNVSVCTQAFGQHPLSIKLLILWLGTTEPTGGNAAEGGTVTWILGAIVWTLSPSEVACRVYGRQSRVSSPSCGKESGSCSAFPQPSAFCLVLGHAVEK